LTCFKSSPDYLFFLSKLLVLRVVLQFNRCVSLLNVTVDLQYVVQNRGTGLLGITTYCTWFDFEWQGVGFLESDLWTCLYPILISKWFLCLSDDIDSLLVVFRCFARLACRITHNTQITLSILTHLLAFPDKLDCSRYAQIAYVWTSINRGFLYSFAIDFLIKRAPHVILVKCYAIQSADYWILITADIARLLGDWMLTFTCTVWWLMIVGRLFASFSTFLFRYGIPSFLFFLFLFFIIILMS